MLIDIYLTDLITIKNYSKDEWGVSTISEINNIKSRVEFGNKLLRNERGEEVLGKGIIILKPDQTIYYESKIKIEKIRGVSYERPEKEFAILSIEKAHGFSSTHYEVTIG